MCFLPRSALQKRRILIASKNEYHGARYTLFGLGFGRIKNFDSFPAALLRKRSFVRFYSQNIFYL